MISVLRATARFVEQRIGWHRIGFVVSVTIIAIALWVLYRILHEINVHDVIAAVKAVSYWDIALAGLFVAAGYFTLTFYDMFGLHTIERGYVPYHVAALAAFTSYAIGHNLGASVITGSAVRYRIYSAWGLDVVDVAKISFVAGLTFWLGNAAMLGLGVTFLPHAASAVDQLPPWVNRVLAILILAALSVYVSWVWRAPRDIGRSNWKVTLPGGPLTLVQIGIGLVDLACCAAAMYVLVPDEPHIGFMTLGVIFVSATLLGFASYSPGGIGVFDAAMLIALWQFDKESLLAGLLLFRLVYYIVPFALALVLLGLREVVPSFHALHAPPASFVRPDAKAPEAGKAAKTDKTCDAA